MSASKVKRNTEIFKGHDFRRELTFREKKVAEIKREKMRILADIKPVPKYMVTVDLSHARGNLDAVRMCVSELEWKQYPFGRKDQHCDIHWQGQSFEQNPDLYGGKVNKFPGMCWICGKNNLFRVLDQMRLLYPDEYDFYPRTWYLPEQLHQLAHDIRKMTEKRVKPRPTFIIKPDTGSQGEGIYLIRDVGDYLINNGRINVCQEYLGDVFTIDKFKFDLRVYVVLTSVEPIELYICKEGLARFSTVPYEPPTNKNLHETFMHLTNYSLNKKSSTFNRSEREDEGSKRTLTSVFSRMKRHGYNTDKLWKRIEHIVVKTIIAIVPDMKIEILNALPPNKPGPSCFQILGFDILLLHNLKPMLLEINASPSLRIDGEVEISPGVVDYVPSAKDEEVKIPLIRDTLLLVAPKKKVQYLESQKRRRARQEKRRKKHAEEERKRREKEASRVPVHTEKDGMIHIETHHPRSSIVIIRAEDDEDKPKKMKRESSFLLPTVHNVFTNQSDHDYFNHNKNHNNNQREELDNLNIAYKERTAFIDRVAGDDDDDENGIVGAVEDMKIETIDDPENDTVRLVHFIETKEENEPKDEKLEERFEEQFARSMEYSQGIKSEDLTVENSNIKFKSNRSSDLRKMASSPVKREGTNARGVKRDSSARGLKQESSPDWISGESSAEGVLGENSPSREEMEDSRMEDSGNSGDELDVADDYESCLKQLYPEPLAVKYDRMRIYEKLADIFIVALGIRATLRLGPTGFRTFARKCRLNKKGLTNATIDILFIDMQRKWEHVNPERTTGKPGLCFRGFLDACHEIARRRFSNGDMLSTLEEFIEYCEENLRDDQLFQARCNPRMLPRRARPHGYPVLEPITTPIQSPLIVEEQTGLLLDSRLHPRQFTKPSSADDVNLFLRRHGQLESMNLKRTKRTKSRNKQKDED